MAPVVWRLILKRLAFAIPMLLIVSFFSFVLVSLSPVDPATAALGSFATQEQVVATRLELGLDKPLVVQYWSWLAKAVRGDFGNAILGSGSVTHQLNARLPVTLSLVLVASLLVAFIGIGLGVLGAVRGGAVGRGVSFFAAMGLGFPSFWIALVLTSFFAVKWRIFPVTGYEYITRDPWKWFKSLVLPSVAVSLGGIASIGRQTRSAMLDVFSRDFVRVMEANGFSRRSVIYRHALRNAAIPVVTLLSVLSVNLLGAAVVIENIFALPGIGSAAAEATLSRDLPIIQGAVIYFTLIVIAVGILVDVSYSLLDPRVRVR
jgi:peptide/nickel transport system permease protein